MTLAEWSSRKKYGAPCAVIFKKYSPIGELVSFAAQYADTLNKTCGMSVIIADRDVIIACAGVSKKEYTEKKVSDEIEDIIESR